MSRKLTTERIIQHITNATIPGEWEWEAALEHAVEDGWENAADAARFLEQLHPGRLWSAEEYHGLMYHHLTGRWTSAAEVGHIRAGDRHEDMVEAANGNTLMLGRADRLHNDRTSSDAAAVAYLHSMPGTHVFECANGTVLTFNDIVNGVITEEEPG